MKRYLIIFQNPSSFCLVEAPDAEEAQVMGYEAAMRSMAGTPEMEIDKIFELDPEEKCAHCGEKAACVGSYCGQPIEPACNGCCGHGNEDGFCEPL